MMRKLLPGLILLVAAAVVAQNRGDLGFTDTPMLPGLPFHVHDPARPHPRAVAPAALPGGAPSDAIVLFDGKDLARWTRARLDPVHPAALPEPAGWKIGDGYFEVVPRAGDIATREKFGDVQLHLEWAAPTQVRGDSQSRGNSGVFLQGRYEVQVLDSYQNPTYADGQAGAIYGQWPPLMNAARKPGEWQSYDIVFEAPRFEGARLMKPAYLTVFLNGVLLHNRQEVAGPTVHRALAGYVPQPPEDALMLQNHGDAVRYRNIWIRRIGGYDRQEKATSAP
jgi:3-keto-disaccharide hydrolase